MGVSDRLSLVLRTLATIANDGWSLGAGCIHERSRFVIWVVGDRLCMAILILYFIKY